jgi:hypothetical protein
MESCEESDGKENRRAAGNALLGYVDKVGGLRSVAVRPPPLGVIGPQSPTPER